jgi:hypothetical protein
LVLFPDAEGKALADSGRGDQSIGWPYTQEEVAAFGALLRNVAPVTDEDWSALERSLTAQREEMEKRRN